MANLESVHVVNVPNKVERLCSSLDSCPVLHHKLHADKYVVRRNKKAYADCPSGAAYLGREGRASVAGKTIGESLTSVT